MDFDIVNTRINQVDTPAVEIDLVMPEFPVIGFLNEHYPYEGLTPKVYRQAQSTAFQTFKDLMQPHDTWYHRHFIRTNNMIADGVEVEVPVETGRDMGYQHTVGTYFVQRRETDPSTMPEGDKKKAADELIQEFAELYTKVGLQPYYDSYEICKQLLTTVAKKLGVKKPLFRYEFSVGPTSHNLIVTYTAQVAPREFFIFIVAVMLKKVRR